MRHGVSAMASSRSSRCWASSGSKYELAPDAIDPGLDAALTSMVQPDRQIGQLVGARGDKPPVPTSMSRFAGGCPWPLSGQAASGKQRDEGGLDPVECRSRIVGDTGSEKGPYLVEEGRHALRRQVRPQLAGADHRAPRGGLVLPQEGDDPGRVRVRLLVRPPEVEQIAPLAALVEGAQLGGQELVERIGRHGCAVAHRQVRDREQARHDVPEMLVAVDLELDAPARTGLGLEAERELWVLAGLRARGADPFEHAAQ